jgi:hypothetical protein
MADWNKLAFGFGMQEFIVTHRRMEARQLWLRDFLLSGHWL